MQATENCRGARNRIMILMYITWITLSLAPAMVAPPERGFAQGQPEMQQAMDNMVTHKTIITKRANAPSSDGTDYHSVLTAKTSNLLAEAEQVLSSLPNSKERQWIEAFVQRMKAIATMLEKTAQNKNLPKNLNTVNGTPVPEGLPLQPTWPATSAVPGINPFQKMNRMMSKFPVTSPELSKVLPANEYPSERQAVTKPAILSNNKDGEDELVRELESLHQEYSQQEHSKNSKVVDQTPVLTTPSTPLSLESSTAKATDVASEKAQLQAKLIKEIAEFQRLGGVIPNEVINALQSDKNKVTDLAYNQNKNIDDMLKFTEAGMVDRQGLQKLSDLNDEDQKISKASLQKPISEKNIPDQDKQILQMKFNQSFQNIPSNFHPNLQAYPKQTGNNFHYMSPQNKVPYQGVLQNGIQDFQKPNPYNGKYHTIVTPTNQKLGPVPEALKQMMPKPQNFYNGHLPSDYNEYLMRHAYGPYPYVHNWNPKNSTLHLPFTMPLYINKQQLNHQIDTQLSDEMKRELRDGKIIVLSDSVVRSNFEANNGEGATESTPDIQKLENKNATITKN